MQTDDMTPEDAQDAPGAIEGETTPETPPEGQEAQEEAANPIDGADGQGESVGAESSDPESTPDGSEAGSADATPASDGSGSAADGDGSSGGPEAATTPDEDQADEPAEDLMSELEEIRQTAADIADANRKVKKARERLDDQREVVKRAKEKEKELEAALETAQTELQDTIDESERYPLIHAGKQAKEARKAAKAAKKAPKPETPAEPVFVGNAVAIPVDADPSDSIRLDTLTLPKSVLAKLHDSNFHTVGDIRNLQRRHMALTDIRGIGEKAENQILDALDRIWQADQQKAREDLAAKQAEEAAAPAAEEPPPSPEEEAAGDELAQVVESVVLPGDVPEESIPDDVPPPDVEVEAKPKKKKSKKG